MYESHCEISALSETSTLASSQRERFWASPRLLARMLDIVDYGLVLVADDGRVAFVNQIARSELGGSHPLQLHGDLLRARRPQDLQALHAALAGAWHKGLQRLLTLGGDSAGAVTVAVIPMSEPDLGAAAGAMLVFEKRVVCDELTTEAFARHHKLTAAELRVLKQLCTGIRPSEIASRQGVALSTVRTQIGCVREKTGAANIGELVRKVATLPPLVRLLRAA